MWAVRWLGVYMVISSCMFSYFVALWIKIMMNNLSKTFWNQRRWPENESVSKKAVHCWVCAGMLGERGLRLVVHFSSGCATKIDIPWPPGRDRDRDRDTKKGKVCTVLLWFAKMSVRFQNLKERNCTTASAHCMTDGTDFSLRLHWTSRLRLDEEKRCNRGNVSDGMKGSWGGLEKICDKLVKENRCNQCHTVSDSETTWKETCRRFGEVCQLCVTSVWKTARLLFLFFSGHHWWLVSFPSSTIRSYRET
jgi:hypothetical protein